MITSYRVSEDSPEHIRQHHPFTGGYAGFGFDASPQDPDGYFGKFTNVYIYDGKTYLTTQLMDILTGGNARFYDSQAHIGRTRLFDLEANFDTIYKHIEYERRNERERAVQKRNRAIFEWLIDVA